MVRRVEVTDDGLFSAENDVSVEETFDILDPQRSDELLPESLREDFGELAQDCF